MEYRKKIEAKHYDRLAKEWSIRHLGQEENTDVEKLNHRVFLSYQFCEKWIKENVKKGHSVLDYGCGNGMHSILPARLGAKVTGIDISKESLNLARKLAARERVEITFLRMDCEALTFPDNSFDYIFDGGTFSSLNIKKAIPELARVLKPDGALLAIETLGHNPLMNLKRYINKLLGRRTGWAVKHIFKITDLDMMKSYFGSVEAHYFNLISLIAFPFLSLTGGVIFLRALEKIDLLLLKIPFLQKYAFKIVIVASHPKKLMKLLTSTTSVLRRQNC